VSGEVARVDILEEELSFTVNQLGSVLPQQVVVLWVLRLELGLPEAEVESVEGHRLLGALHGGDVHRSAKSLEGL